MFIPKTLKIKGIPSRHAATPAIIRMRYEFKFGTCEDFKMRTIILKRLKNTV